MEQALSFIFHPDHWNDMNYFGPVFSVKEIMLLEHTGGGGVVGIQSLDGKQWSTLTYGLRQPGLWLLSTEQDRYTHEITGLDEELEANFDVGMTYQMVITFKTVRRHRNGKFIDQEITFYRNGISYGDPYIARNVPVSRLSEKGQTRIVMGARTTFGVQGFSDE